MPLQIAAAPGEQKKRNDFGYLPVNVLTLLLGF